MSKALSQITSEATSLGQGLLNFLTQQESEISRLSSAIAAADKRIKALESTTAAPESEIDRRKFIVVPRDQWDITNIAKRIETLGTNAKVLKSGVEMLQLFKSDGRIGAHDGGGMAAGVVSDLLVTKLDDMAAQADNALKTCLAIREGLTDAGLL